MLEVCKSLNMLNPEFMLDIYRKNDTTYTFRAGKTLTVPRAFLTRGTNSIEFRGALAWNRFKDRIKNVKVFCQCKICS